MLLKKTRESNIESRRVMLERGTEFIKFDRESLRVLQEKREEAVNGLIPDSLSKGIYDRTMDLIKEYRGKTAGGKAN
ncbi:MAG: hypothetical protein ACD_75C01331G0001 [uncultured bacterium]|nr:MAG: hypothetical protein ACD_75C01331G0001 [uncultured bacterium]